MNDQGYYMNYNPQQDTLSTNHRESIPIHREQNISAPVRSADIVHSQFAQTNGVRREAQENGEQRVNKLNGKKNGTERGRKDRKKLMQQKLYKVLKDKKYARTPFLRELLSFMFRTHNLKLPSIGSEGKRFNLRDLSFQELQILDKLIKKQEKKSRQTDQQYSTPVSQVRKRSRIDQSQYQTQPTQSYQPELSYNAPDSRRYEQYTRPQQVQNGYQDLRNSIHDQPVNLSSRLNPTRSGALMSPQMESDYLNNLLQTQQALQQIYSTPATATAAASPYTPNAYFMQQQNQSQPPHNQFFPPQNSFLQAQHQNSMVQLGSPFEYPRGQLFPTVQGLPQQGLLPQNYQSSPLPSSFPIPKPLRQRRVSSEKPIRRNSKKLMIPVRFEGGGNVLEFKSGLHQNKRVKVVLVSKDLIKVPKMSNEEMEVRRTLRRMESEEDIDRSEKRLGTYPIKTSGDPDHYCICKRLVEESEMIECSSTLKHPVCNRWVHPECVKLTARKLNQIKVSNASYTCPYCTSKLKGKQVDLLAAPSHFYPLVCAFCCGDKEDMKHGDLMGPFINEEQQARGTYVHELCAHSASRVGVDRALGYYNIISSSRQAKLTPCSSQDCKRRGKPGVSLICVNCKKSYHPACQESFQKRLHNIPVIKSGNDALNLVMAEQAVKYRTKFADDLKKSFICSSCRG
eukprot:augustus_masked-scaffold_3-processed-gene-15.12-mRNA-1 protein AED:1.00 eAED:1.00 QI:0/-1/0/0/-1/1/1/0/680